MVFEKPIEEQDERQSQARSTVTAIRERLQEFYKLHPESPLQFRIADSGYGVTFYRAASLPSLTTATLRAGDAFDDAPNSDLAYSASAVCRPHDTPPYFQKLSRAVRIAVLCGFAFMSSPHTFLNPVAVEASEEVHTKSQAAYNQGVARMNLKMYVRAIQYFNDTLTLEPNFASALYNRAVCYMNLQRHDQAIADLDQFLRLAPADDPNRLKAYYNRGVSFMNLNKHKEAIADFSMVIQGTKATNAQKAQAYRNRAKSKTAIGDLKGAEEDLTAYSQHAK